MRKIVSLVFGACTLVLSPLIQAEAGWTDYVTIAELVPTAYHYYKVRLPVKENPSGCKNKTWFYQDYRPNGSHKMFQTILEGLKLKMRVRVYVTGKCNLGGYSEISSVSIIP